MPLSAPYKLEFMAEIALGKNSLLLTFSLEGPLLNNTLVKNASKKIKENV